MIIPITYVLGISLRYLWYSIYESPVSWTIPITNELGPTVDSLGCSRDWTLGPSEIGGEGQTDDLIEFA